jgi:hypothetical protein
MTQLNHPDENKDNGTANVYAPEYNIAKPNMANQASGGILLLLMIGCFWIYGFQS